MHVYIQTDITSSQRASQMRIRAILTVIADQISQNKADKRLRWFLLNISWLEIPGRGSINKSVQWDTGNVLNILPRCFSSCDLYLFVSCDACPTNITKVDAKKQWEVFQINHCVPLLSILHRLVPKNALSTSDSSPSTYPTRLQVHLAT